MAPIETAASDSTTRSPLRGATLGLAAAAMAGLVAYAVAQTTRYVLGWNDVGAWPGRLWDATLVGSATLVAWLVTRERFAARRLQSVLQSRSRAVRRLERLEGRLRRAIEALAIVPWEADGPTWRARYVGPQAEALLGYPMEAYYRDGFWVDHIDVRDRERVLSEASRALATLDNFHLEYRMTSAAGRPVWVHHIAHVSREAGRPDTIWGLMIDVTARKEAEAELSYRGKYMDEILDHLPVVAFRIDGQGVLTESNGSGLAIAGMRTGESVGQNTLEVFPAVAKYVRRALAGETVYFEHHGFNHGRPWSYQVCMFFDALRGEGAQGFAIDITASKQAERSLRYRIAYEDLVASISRRFVGVDVAAIDAAVEEALAMVCGFVGADRGVVFAYEQSSRQLVAQHEWRREGLEPILGERRAFDEQAFPSTIAAFQRGEAVHFDDLSKPSQSVEFGEEARLLSDLGLRALIDVPLRFESELIGVLGVGCEQPRAWPPDAISLLTTIGEIIANALRRRAAEQALRESVLLNETILAGSMDGFALTEAGSGRFLDVNDAFCRICGYERGEILTMRLGDLAAASADRITRAAHIEALPRTGMYPLRIRCKDGTLRQLEVSSSYVDVGEGRWASLARDVTDRVRAQAELVKAKHAAEIANEAKADFLARVSHEVRTPMHGILGVVELMLETRTEGEDAEYLQTIRHCADTLLVIIDDILDFSKIEAGKLTLHTSEFELQKLMTRATDLAAAEARRKGLHFAVGIDPDVPERLRGDPTRILQILSNLVDNAVKFTEDGSVRVHVSRVDETDTHVTLRIFVSDTGIGIAGQDKARVFDAFSQVHGSSTRRYGGTGLGLAICKQLVDMMDGEIDMESTPGRGSTFWFLLQLGKLRADVQHVADKQQQVPRTRDAGVSMLGLGCRILVVEDNDVNQLVLQRHLKRLGFDVDLAANGVDALNALARQEYGLVLMDCNMPELDGYDVTRELRRREKGGRRTPVVALTALTGEAERAKCLAAGMDDFISKPASFERLQAAIREWARPVSESA